jgi:hypothetical protein
VIFAGHGSATTPVDNRTPCLAVLLVLCALVTWNGNALPDIEGFAQQDHVLLWSQSSHAAVSLTHVEDEFAFVLMGTISKDFEWNLHGFVLLRSNAMGL